MRKLLSSLLLATFLLPLFAAMLALGETAESRLPACCRRNGAHHCSMSPAEIEALLQGHHFGAVHSHCPLYPHASSDVRLPDLALPCVASLRCAPPASSVLRATCDSHIPLPLEGDRHPRGPPAGTPPRPAA